jgi:hypothetical protein
MRVRIVKKSSNSSAWSNNHVGRVFEVVDYDNDDWVLKNSFYDEYYGESHKGWFSKSDAVICGLQPSQYIKKHKLI